MKLLALVSLIGAAAAAAPPPAPVDGAVTGDVIECHDYKNFATEGTGIACFGAPPPIGCTLCHT